MNYIHTLKRIRERKTNYHKRSSLLLSSKQFITINITNQNISAQLLEPFLSGDRVITSVHGRNLTKLGWKGSLNSLPACYLTGLLLGKKASDKKVKSAILYTGKNTFTERTAACLKGIVDSGIQMPTSYESLPDDERISGGHIAKYAIALQDNQDLYKKQFSSLIKNKLNPKDYKTHFEKVKKIILNTDVKDLVNKLNRSTNNNKQKKGNNKLPENK